MEINATEKDFANWIEKMLGVSLKEKDDQFIYNIESYNLVAYTDSSTVKDNLSMATVDKSFFAHQPTSLD